MKRAMRVAAGKLSLASGALAMQITYAQQAGGGTAATASPFVGLMQMLLALVVVLGLIAVFAWFMRRVSTGQRLAGSHLKIRGGVMLGPRERVVLIEVADTWIVVGVGGGQISALHAMPRPVDVEPAAGEGQGAVSFSSWLQRATRSRSTPTS